MQCCVSLLVLCRLGSGSNRVLQATCCVLYLCAALVAVHALLYRSSSGVRLYVVCLMICVILMLQLSVCGVGVQPHGMQLLCLGLLHAALVCGSSPLCNIWCLYFAQLTTSEPYANGAGSLAPTQPAEPCYAQPLVHI